MKLIKPERFTEENSQLEYALKLAYKHAMGDVDAGTNETIDALCDAICNLIGDHEFCEWIGGNDAAEEFFRLKDRD